MGEEERERSRLRGRAVVAASAAVVIGAALVVSALLIAGSRHAAAPPVTSSTTTETSGPPPASTVPVALLRPSGPNLIDNPLLLGAPQGGLAPGLLAWGVNPSYSVVTVPVHALPLQSRGGVKTALVRAQREMVPHRVGGAWYTVVVKPGAVYLEQLALDVTSLAPGARVDLNLEWYAVAPEGVLRSLGAVAQHRWSTTRGFVEISQAAEAPPGVRQAHVVVNVVGGGTAIFTRASLRLASRR